MLLKMDFIQKNGQLCQNCEQVIQWCKLGWRWGLWDCQIIRTALGNGPNISSLTEGIFGDPKGWVELGGLIIKKDELLSKAVPT
jgi:hypothetical protein